MSFENSTAIAARPSGARRFVHAALLAGVIGLGASVFGHTAIANAEFKWNTYKNCMAQPHVEDSEETYHAACCLLAHGTWNANTHVCTEMMTDGSVQDTPLGPKLGQPGRQQVPPPSYNVGPLQ